MHAPAISKRRIELHIQHLYLLRKRTPELRRSIQPAFPHLRPGKHFQIPFQILPQTLGIHPGGIPRMHAEKRHHAASFQHAIPILPAHGAEIPRNTGIDMRMGIEQHGSLSGKRLRKTLAEP
ncbi:hypothetical protein AC781_02425 [Akkermansia glycaniphila]|nr:hypothetical protein AC781_02425 [Akkermansia glycaniphila]